MLRHRLALSIALSLLVSAGVASRSHAATPAALDSGTVQLAETPLNEAAGCRRAPTKQCVIAMAAAAVLAIKTDDPPSYHVIEIAQAQVAAGDIVGALATTSEFGATRNSANYHEFLISIAETPEAGAHVHAILAAAARIPSDYHAVLTLNRIAAKLSDAGNYDAARDAFLSATTVARTTQPLSSRAAAFVEIAKAAAAAGDPHAAKDAIESALATAKMPVTPSVRAQIRVTVAEIQATIGDHSAALATVASISDPSARVAPLARIAEAQAAAGNHSAAQDTIRAALAAAAKASGIDRTRNLLRIAGAQNSIGDRVAAAELIEVLLATAPSIEDQDLRASVQLQIVQLQTIVGDFDAALAMTETIEHPSTVTTIHPEGTSNDGSTRGVMVRVGRRDQALQHIAAAQARAGDAEAALATMAKVPDPYLRTQSLSNLAKACSEAGNVEAARTIVAAAVSTLDQVKAGLREHLFFPDDIFATLVAVGDVGTAVAIAATIADEQRRRFALRRIAEIWGKTADMAAVERMDDPFVRTLALAGVAIQRASAADVDAARRAIAAALTASSGVDGPKVRPWALLAIAEAQAAIGDVEGARAIMDSILATTTEPEGEWLRFSVTRSFANAQAKSGDYAAALVTVDDKVQHPWYRMVALLDIVAALPK